MQLKTATLQGESSVFHFSLPSKEKCLATGFLIASKLNDPLCTAHRLFRQIKFADVLYPDVSKIELAARKVILFLAACLCAALSLITTPLAIGLRLIMLSIQDKPFLHFRGEAEEKELTGDTLTLLSWNLCGALGGFSITDGGVSPWPSRLNQLIAAIREQNADVVCLYEVFDIETALRLVDGLKDTYSHFYFNMNPKAIQPTSALFVASKVKLTNPECIAFPQEALDGRGKYSNKGVFSFDVQKRNESFVRIFTTHPQHSEIPGSPTPDEKKARKKAMEIIVEKIEDLKNTPAIVTGDLNLDDQEYNESEWSKKFDKGEIKGEGYTWGGDQFCATRMGKQFSPPSNLDHTMVTKNSRVVLSTTYVETGYDGTKFKPEALSDHKGLLTTIKKTNV